MRTHTSTIHIAAPAADVHALVADLDQLPRWAIGFAKAVEHDGDGHVVTLTSGDRVPIAMIADHDAGTADFHVNGVPAYTRTVPVEGGCLHTFTMVAEPGEPDEVFDAKIEALGHELTVLKAIAEASCPL
jgi:Polyketide cyclase / dehydrase and lipid transport